MIHRHIVEYQSIYFKELLPGPPAVSEAGPQDEAYHTDTMKSAARIQVRIDCAPESLVHCLYFMYTGSKSHSRG